MIHVLTPVKPHVERIVFVGGSADGTNATAPVQWFTLTADLDNSHFVKWTEIRVDSKKMHALHGTQSGDVDCLDSTTDMVCAMCLMHLNVLCSVNMYACNFVSAVCLSEYQGELMMLSDLRCHSCCVYRSRQPIWIST